MKSPQFSLSNSLTVILLLGACLFAVFPVDALAGPGGEIVEAIFKTKIGRILAIIAAIILLPLIIMYYVGMSKGIKRTLADLETLAETYPFFQWEEIESRARKTAEVIYGEWSGGELKQSAEYLTPDYLLSQQAILDMWEDEGKHNITEMKSIGKIKPLKVQAQDWTRPATVVVQVTMTIKDYMIEKGTGKKIKGKKKFDSVDQVFTMVYENDQWLLSAIENDSENLNLATEPNEIHTDRTLAEMKEISGSKLAGAQAAEDEPATEVEKPGVGIRTEEDQG